jgi:hypothetical protein
MMKVKRLGSSSMGLSSSTSLPDRATNAWAVWASADDLSTLGGVVQTVGSAADAFPPGMVKTS